MLSAVTLERLSLSLTLAAAILSPSVAATSCYYPSGATASSDVPCGNGTAACCGEGAVCLSNGLCMDISQPYVLARSSCTDQSWTSPNCPNYCLQDETYNKSGCSIVLYTFVDNTSKYCCNNIIASDNELLCGNNYSTIEIPDSDIVSGYGALSDYVLANETSTSSNTTNSTASTNCSSAAVSSSNHDAAIGAGVGIPLGVIALASIAWALWERRKLNRLQGNAVNAAAAAVTATEPMKAEASYPATFSQDGSQTEAGVYGQQHQQYTTQPRVMSEMAGGGPVELDSQRG